MDTSEIGELSGRKRERLLQYVASGAALVGVVDSVYLTVHHFTDEPVPCTITGGCESVLTSSYAEIAGIPLAAFGAAAYFTAFSLSLLAAFGDKRMWAAFGVLVSLMAGFSIWLIYLQGFVIGAFCQFCLLSALTTFSLFLLFVFSGFTRVK